MSEENQEEKSKVESQRFCKGQMPMCLVWFIKFHEDTENKSALAKLYFTTAGKIADIQSGSNQKYIVEDMKWSAEDLAAAAETIEANFVRGQDDELIMANPDANKRKLATTQEGDNEYSLSVIDKIAGMDFANDAVSIIDARATYNTANPRSTKPKETLGETDADQSEDTVSEEEVDAVDDLLD